MSRGEAFRRLHRPGEPLLLPNAWDVASAALFAASGFPAVGTTSLGVAAAAGRPDGRAATRAETLALAERLAGLPCLLSVDLEGGFDTDPAAVAETARRLHDCGVVGINLEDGRSDGTLAPVAQQRSVIAAVKAAVPDLFVNARTDTFWLAARPPISVDGTVRRLAAYAAAGADGVFVPGLTDPGLIERLVRAVDRPVNLLVSPSGPGLRQLAELGVARVSCGSLLFRAALTAAVRALNAIATDGPLPAGTLRYEQVQGLAEMLTGESGTRAGGGRP
ncbi:MAG TPA: isocitrate lyase/phosphoenolpyruvate mutase family protein [Micromonosporaceae bacterium]